MAQIDEQSLQSLIRTLHELIIRYHKKPYLPIWGELFCTLRDIRKISQRLMQSTPLYSIDPIGRMSYDIRKDAFTAEINELNITITLTLHELIDALIQGRFQPILKASSHHVERNTLIAKSMSSSYNG